MRPFTLIVMGACLSPLLVQAAANCQQSSSWQCQHRAHSQAGAETHPQVILPATSAEPGATTPALGSLPTNHNAVELKPMAQTVIEGTAPVPVLTGERGSGFTGSGTLPITVTATPGQTFTGVSPVQAPQPIPTPSFTGTGTVPITVTATPGQTFTGVSPVQAPQPIPTPSFTGTGTVPIMVTATPGQTFTGVSPVQAPQPMPTPSFTGSGTVPITVTATPGQTFTGVSPVQALQPIPTPSFTGTGTVPITVTATPGQTFTGVSPVQAPQPIPTPSFTGTGTVPAAGFTAGVPPAGGANGGAVQAPQGGMRPATHVLDVHRPPSVRPVTSGDYVGEHPYSLELIEPGIQGHTVEVYRSKDVREVTYQDINPLDAGGFHLRVIGIRNPEYSH